MRQILFIATFFITACSFGQQTGSIKGCLLDIESNNKPLLYAKVSIKETGAEVTTNEEGAFTFDNLKAGYYTLVSSFVGYETKEYSAEVSQGQSTQIKLHLKADSISIDDLMSTLARADKKSTSVNK